MLYAPVTSKTLIAYSMVFFAMIAPACEPANQQHNWYFDPASGISGASGADGSREHPFSSLDKVKSLTLSPGDSILLKGGAAFRGQLAPNPGSAGSPGDPVVIAGYGGERPVIDAGNGTALMLTQCNFFRITGLVFRGSGRKSGNTSDGVLIDHAGNITIENCDISGFRKSGLLIYASMQVRAADITAHENGSAGIFVSGIKGKKDCRDIQLVRCVASNNPGNPVILNNHSGNGILAALCTRVRIDSCSAFNNGWDMPRKGNGPVGIWTFESDSIVIQHCLSFENKTSPGSEDGGGFDLDGGVTNSVIQYCLSYRNQGAGIGLFQYAGASPWRNNIVRYNISENDGTGSTALAGIYIWNNSGDAASLAVCDLYGNTVYNDRVAAVRFAPLSARRGFRFINNILVGKDSVLMGPWDPDEYIYNVAWSVTRKRNPLMGLILDPGFRAAGRTTTGLATELAGFRNYIPSNAALKTAGMELPRILGLKKTIPDFNGHPAPVRGIGASFNNR